MALRKIPKKVDTVVVGNGPSALLLSFILHGNTPYYDLTNPHPDPILHQKLQKSPCLLDIDINDLTAHFAASRLSYSTQALPVNVLLDTLLRPLADTNPGEYNTCVRWQYESERKVDHAILGNTLNAGGQWADNPVAGSWDIGALSYAEMLALPGYSLQQHLSRKTGKAIEDFHRPSRREVADYLRVYPAMVGIEDSVYTNANVYGVQRIEDGFFVESHSLRCKRLVLASGTFSNLIPARPLLQPLLSLPDTLSQSNAPLLVVGSGFTAADVILSTPRDRKIIHIFKWAPEDHPSPLRACHPRAYPEYASIYRRMKLAAKRHLGSREVFSPMRKKQNPFERPNWEDFYEGFPNTYIKSVEMYEKMATITLEDSTHALFEREVSCMQYVIGRRGSLGYLGDHLQAEVLSGSSLDARGLVAGGTLRPKAQENLEVIQEVFITGSLTGDSLIRFAFGGCVYAAREIICRKDDLSDNADRPAWHGQRNQSKSETKRTANGHLTVNKSEYEYMNGHVGLENDTISRARSKKTKSLSDESARNYKSWLGGCKML